MKSVHLVITDLFLPKDITSEVCADLRLPALEKILACGRSETLRVAPFESWLCNLFGISYTAGAPIAPLSAAFDGLPPGCWLRADPVHLRLQREQLVLLPNVETGADEAAQICASLNQHFAGQGMEFFAPHPQRWYMKLDRLPDIETVTLSQAAGRNVHDLLPKGREAMHWHRLFNEIQMLLFAHPVNEAREARGELPVNSVWLWGGGCTENVLPQKNYDCASSDEVLAEMLAKVAGIPFVRWQEQWRSKQMDGRSLLVWTGLRSALQCGDLAAWRNALQDFEIDYVQPLWRALRSGEIVRLQVDILGGAHVPSLCLSCGDAWVFWKRARPLSQYS